MRRNLVKKNTVVILQMNYNIMERTNWVDREFNLGIPEEWLPNILTRLNSVTIHLKHLTKNIPDDYLSNQFNNKWSIKEHIGHLADLEDLHIGRVTDFMNKEQVLRAADMSNKRTYAANHNEKSIKKLIEEFALKRITLIASLRNLDATAQQFVAMHPRLKAPMKAVDMAFFTAEHDDHHITSIYEILEL